MIIYRLTDRIPVKMGELTFWVSPLSFEQKMNMTECTKIEAGVTVVDFIRRARMGIKYAIKKVDGLKVADGSPYVVTLDAQGCLSDESVDEIMNLDGIPKLAAVCAGLMNGVQDMSSEGIEMKLDEVVTEKKA